MQLDRSLLLPALLLVASGCSSPAAPQAQRLPNVVILYADDLGYGDVSCYNPDSRIRTPHIDRLAREGMRFTDAHSSSGICTPSRYALLTGRHHWRKFHEIVDSFGPPVIEQERLTMPEMLRTHGYRTACFGKWHLGWDWDAIRRPGAKLRTEGGKSLGYSPDAFDWSRPIPGGPLAHGFDSYFGDDVPNFPPYAWIEGDRLPVAPTEPYAADPVPSEGQAEGRPGPMVRGWRQDEVMPTLQRRAVAWIEEQSRTGSPFFLYFPFTSPHAPIVPTAAFAGASDAGAYGDFVVQSDAVVGAVLDALDRLGCAENTIVVFASDNGPETYAFERVRAFGHRSMGSLRGLKRDVWEGGHRTPFVVRWPAAVPAGTVSDALLGQVDLMATLAAVVGHELPRDAGEDSFDQLPVLRGDVGSLRPWLVHNTYKDRYALREGDWLYLEGKGGSHSQVPAWFRDAEGWLPVTTPFSLYDLRKDPGQRTDLAPQHPEVVARMKATLRQLRDQGHSAARLAGT